MTDKLRDFLGSELAGMWADGERIMASSGGGFHDYSFMVFPFAKVYEGFLKKYFLKIGAINEHQYYSDHWRVGKALNPQLEKELRGESVYDHLDPDLGNVLWKAWKEGRNAVFHYFPQKNQVLSFEKARDVINQLTSAMELGIISLETKADTIMSNEAINNEQSIAYKMGNKQ